MEISNEQKILGLMFIAFIILLMVFAYRDRKIVNTCNTIIEEHNTCIRILENHGMDYEAEKALEKNNIVLNIKN
jgi:hypothetical protein